jgi:hypothetical protein
MCVQLLSVLLSVKVGRKEETVVDVWSEVFDLGSISGVVAGIGFGEHSERGVSSQCGTKHHTTCGFIYTYLAQQICLQSMSLHENQIISPPLLLFFSLL